MPRVWSSLSALQAFERLGGIEQSSAAARDDAFFDRSAGCVERVIDAVLAFLHFDFGEAPPTLITATPPASLARRSCSFSRS